MKWTKGKQQLTFEPDFPKRWLENPELLPSMSSLNDANNRTPAETKLMEVFDAKA